MHLPAAEYFTSLFAHICGKANVYVSLCARQMSLCQFRRGQMSSLGIKQNLCSFFLFLIHHRAANTTENVILVDLKLLPQKFKPLILDVANQFQR